MLWNRFLGARDLAIFAGMYVLSAFGITVGFHRLLTHRAFETRRLAAPHASRCSARWPSQGPVIDWVADHRKHHAFADEEGDPHSPHVGARRGPARGPARPLARARRLAVRPTQGQAPTRRYAPDLLDDPRHAPGQPRLPADRARPTLLIPFAARLRAQRRLARRRRSTALLWGGLVRIFLLHHVTWSINSICHFFGRRRFDTDDESTNVFWLALPSLGEAWHHNHHAFPRSAFHGLRWYELDPSGWVIMALRRLGLAWDVGA